MSTIAQTAPAAACDTHTRQPSFVHAVLTSRPNRSPSGLAQRSPVKDLANISVLLTGASGVVGAATCKELRDLSMTCLVHRTRPFGSPVEQVRGDITQPRLGLDAAEFRSLAKKTDVVIHSAAMTDFTATDGVTADLNVNGTANVLELAALADAPLYYISTAFVERADALRDAPDGGGPAAYLHSKCAAEGLVAASGVPSVVLRPSVVIGDAESGAIAAFQGLHAIAGAIVKGALPLLPLLPETLIDFVPQDFVARAIGSLVRADVRTGEYWLTAGERALAADDVVDICAEVAASLGQQPVSPRLVAPDIVDRLIRPVFIETLPERARTQFDQMLNMTALFSTEAEFTSSAKTLERDFGVALPSDLRACFKRSVEYWAAKKGLGAAKPGLGVQTRRARKLVAA